MISNSRRNFLQSSAALAIGLAGSPVKPLAAEQAGGQAPATEPKPDTLQTPKMKFGGVEIGRLVLGCNPINGNMHFNGAYNTLIREWFTADKAVAMMLRATTFGVNAFNYSNSGRCPEIWERFCAAGGQMHLSAGNSSSTDDPVASVKTRTPHAFHRQGEVVDVAFRTGKMAAVREWCKKVRDTGVMVGVATHKPEVIALVEEQGWDVDYFAGCVYHRTRTDEEWRRVLNGELMEMSREIYMQSDPARMYKAMRQTAKPCFAFKILAAGRITEGGIQEAFRTAFGSIKATDGVFVGMFPGAGDQLRDNVERVRGILTGA